MTRLLLPAAVAISTLLWTGPAFSQGSPLLAPPAPAKTGVSGKVTDENGEGLAGAVVEVANGDGQLAIVEADGSYELELPAGSYEIRIYTEVHEPRVFEVELALGQSAKIDAQLAVNDDEGEVIVMSGKIDKGRETAQLDERRFAITVSDRLSSQEMARSPDSSAADAAKRVVSVTVRGGKYVMLRGLGDRYVTTVLNGVMLPSPEPDRQAIPLDLFPTSFLSNLSVLKSYSAELPGIFGGGTMSIATNTYPDEREVSIKLSMGANSESNVGEIFTQTGGGSLDFFGYDDGTRALPAEVPNRPVVMGDAMSAEEVEAIGESFSVNWAPGTGGLTPNLGVGLSVGDTVQMNGRALGYLASVTFNHRLAGRQSQVAKARNVGGELEYRENLDSGVGREIARLGALLNTGYTLRPGHQIALFNLYSHSGESIANVVRGFNENDGEDVVAQRLQFIERGLNFTQLTGTHKLSGKAELKWQGNISFSQRDEKDTRDISYNLFPNDVALYKDQPGSGERFFADLGERSLGAGVEVKVPTSRVKVHAGASVQSSDRVVEARRFRYRFIGTDNSIRSLSPNEMLSPTHIGPDFMLTERTLATDSYDANLTIMAAFASAELEASEKLRIIGGLRFESSMQDLIPGSPYAVNGAITDDDITERSDNDFLPVVNAVYSLREDMNVRAAYSYTLARPKFRELAPFLYFDYVRRRSISGNPQLLNTHIHNADLRWEWFAGGRDVFAVSGFYKSFTDPIEQVVFSASGGDATFANTAGAQTLGIELEARTSLGRFSKALDAFAVGTNLSLISSSIRLSQDQLMSQTSAERPLQGQSPYVVNVNVSYVNPTWAEFSLFYNVIGARIIDVGFDSLPDIYEQPFHRLDLKVSKRVVDNWKLSLSATNILNDNVQLKQGGLPVLDYRPGVSMSVGLRFEP